MTLIKPYSASFYVGDNETKEFPFTFDEVSESFVKVLVSHADGSVSIPTYTVDLQLKQVVFGDETPAPTDDDVVCIYRATPVIQDTPFRTLQGYNAQALENILSKIVAMIQEIKSTYFSTQVLQGDPWQLDLLKSEDDGATVNIDYVAKKLVKGLYFRINNGNLQVSADGSSYITMPKSSDIVEFRQVQTVLPDLTVQYRLQYRIGNEWFNAESNAEATADEALRIAEEARDTADDAKDIAQDASDKVDGFDDRITQAEQDASDAKDIAQDASDAVSAHITDTNNPHSVTASQVGALPNTTKYGAVLSLTINSTTYVLTAQLKDQDGNNLGTAQTIDLPLESVVVSGSYDSDTKEVVLTLQGGSTIRFSVADLVSGLQTEITALNMLSADLVDDTSTTHKFVTTTEKTTWNGKQDAISDLATIRSGASAGATAVQPADLATVATTGDYDDLLNKPTIPAAQVNSDWNANSGVAQILNKPTLATVATSGSYNDLSNKPTIPTVNNPTITITQGGVTKGSFTLNQATGDTIALDAGGSGSGYHPDLFDVKWADHICNDVQWLRADTFSWQSGAVYQAAYQHLADDIDGKTLQSETIGSTTIQFYLADDGHKICPASEETNVSAIYNATGVAWYYIIDTANTRFKLPRTQFAFTGIRNGVGGFVEAGLPNITGRASSNSQWNSASGVFVGYQDTSHSYRNNNASGYGYGYDFDASRSSSVYGNSDTVQPKATEMYLYFYVGNFTQTALENTAGLNVELFNGKVDLDFGNTTMIDYVVEKQDPTSSNNYTWYRKYKSGWVEQGQSRVAAADQVVQITFPVEMADTYYVWSIGRHIYDVAAQNTNESFMAVKSRTTTGFSVSDRWGHTYAWCWQVSGMAAN